MPGVEHQRAGAGRDSASASRSSTRERFELFCAQKGMLPSGPDGSPSRKGGGVALKAAAGRFDLDGGGAEVGEQLTAVGADLIGEFEDADARERAFGHS